MSADEAIGVDDDAATGEANAEPSGSEGPDATHTIEERVRDVLRDVIDPCSAATGSRLNVVEMGLVSGIEVESGDGDGAHVHVDLHLTSPMCHQVPYFYEEIEGTVGDLDGVASATLDTDYGLEWTEEMLSEEAKRKRRAVLEEQEARYRREIEAD